MAYTKKNFKAGSVLSATQMNDMDNQIAKNQQAIGDLNKLNTNIKTTLVDAINQAATTGSGEGGSGVISDYDERIEMLEFAADGSIMQAIDTTALVDVIQLPSDTLPYLRISRIIGHTDGGSTDPHSSPTLTKIIARNASGVDSVLVDVSNTVNSLFEGEMHSSLTVTDEINLRQGYAVKNTAKVDSTAAMDSFSHSSNTYGGYWICHILTKPRVRQVSDPRVRGTRRIASGSGYPGYTGVRTTANADYFSMYLADSDSGIDGSATKEQAEAAFRAYMAENGVAVIYALKTPEQVSIDAGAYFEKGDAVELRMVGADGELVMASLEASIMRKKVGDSESEANADTLEASDVPVFETADEYNALFQQFVDDGYAIRETIATVEGVDIYAYLFTFDTVRLDPDYNKVDVRPATIDEYDAYYFKKRRIMFTSGMHGDEKASPSGLYRIMRSLCYEEGFAKYRAFDYYVIPLVNPTGYNANTRSNYQGININRDAVSKSSAEAAAVSEFIAKRTYDLYVDWHQAATHGGGSTNPILGFVSIAYNEPAERMLAVNEALSAANAETDRLVNQYYNKPQEAQGCFCWKGGSNSQIYRNFALQYAKYSCCFETSRSCVYYTGNGNAYNSNALRICYTYQHNVFKRLMDLIIADTEANNADLYETVGRFKNKLQEIDETINDITGVGYTIPVKYPAKTNMYINLENTTVNLADPYSESSSQYRPILERCNPGDKYCIIANGSTGSKAKMWGFLDAEGNVLATSNVTGYHTEYVEAPQNAAWLVVNHIATSTAYPTPDIKKYGYYTIPQVKEYVDNINKQVQSDWISCGYYSYPNLIDATNVDIDKWGQRLLTSSEKLTRQVIGYATGADGSQMTDYPIYAYTFKNNVQRSGQSIAEKHWANVKQPTILITSGIHGDQKSAVVSVMRLMDDVMNDDIASFIADKYKIIFVPLINPYGFANNIRLNARGVNLNRNFEPYYAEQSVTPTSEKGASALSEFETQAMDTLFQKEDYLFYVDYHNTIGTGDYGHSISYDEPMLRIGQQVFQRQMRTFNEYGWPTANQTSNQPVVFSKRLAQTFAQAHKYGIPSFLGEAPTADAGNTKNVDTPYSDKSLKYAYERLLNIVSLISRYYDPNYCSVDRSLSNPRAAAPADIVGKIVEPMNILTLNKEKLSPRYGINVQVIDDNTYRMYGTSTSGTNIWYFWNEATGFSNSTSHSPSKIFESGTYTLFFEKSGYNGITPHFYYTTSTCTSTNRVQIQNGVSFSPNAPFSVFTFFSSGANYGTAEDPTIVHITMGHNDNPTAVDKYARDKIHELSNKADLSLLGGLKFQRITQEDYDLLETKDENTMYVIVG